MVPQNRKSHCVCHHQVMMDAIRSAVRINPRKPLDYIFISGSTSQGEKNRHPLSNLWVIATWRSYASSGTGHNFACASTVIFTELDWNPSTHLQCRIVCIVWDRRVIARFGIYWPKGQQTESFGQCCGKMTVTNSVLGAGRIASDAMSPLTGGGEEGCVQSPSMVGHWPVALWPRTAFVPK